jgi:hypothetical protein
MVFLEIIYAEKMEEIIFRSRWLTEMSMPVLVGWQAGDSLSQRGSSEADINQRYQAWQRFRIFCELRTIFL